MRTRIRHMRELNIAWIRFGNATKIWFDDFPIDVQSLQRISQDVPWFSIANQDVPDVPINFPSSFRWIFMFVPFLEEFSWCFGRFLQDFPSLGWPFSAMASMALAPWRLGRAVRCALKRRRPWRAVPSAAAVARPWIWRRPRGQPGCLGICWWLWGGHGSMDWFKMV